jgi:hypothetical protein
MSQSKDYANNAFIRYLSDHRSIYIIRADRFVSDSFVIAISFLGLQDAHNLAWKLKLVLDNVADNCLLKTYEIG